MVFKLEDLYGIRTEHLYLIYCGILPWLYSYAGMYVLDLGLKPLFTEPISLTCLLHQHKESLQLDSTIITKKNLATLV